MLRTTVGLLLLCMSGGIAMAQGSAMAPPPMNADAMKWNAAPPVLPQGAQMSVISGDPSKDGPYVVRRRDCAPQLAPGHGRERSKC